MAQSQSIADLLAKELGYKDKTELKKVIRGRSDTFSGEVLGRLEEGEGFRSAFSGSAKEQVEGFKEKFSKKGLKKFGRKAYRTAFAGEDIFSAYMRGRLRKKEKKELEEEGIEEGEGSPTKLGGDSEVYLKVIAKESIAIPTMARDVNVMRQNLQKLVKLWGGKAATAKEVDVGNSEKLPQEEIDKISAEVDAKKEGTKQRAEDVSFFEKQDKIEAEQEAGRKKDKGAAAATTPTPEKKEGEGGFLDSIMSFFANGFVSGIKKLFSPKMLGQILKKVFLPIAIIGTLFSGITDGFKRYQETGSFSEAIVAGLGGMLKFLTFGLFGEDTLKSLWSAVSDFLSPITDTISTIFTNIKDFFKKLFGMGDEEDKGKTKIDKVTPQMPDMKSTAEGAAKAAGESDQKASDIGGMFGAVQSGDVKGLMSKAQEFSAKYPSEPPKSETTPTPMTKEGVPSDQAQRNYELNKQLTGEASKALGVPLKAPEPPTPATPPSPVTTAPTPAPEMSDSDKIKQLEGYIEGNKTRFAKREAEAERHIASFKKRYPNDPTRVKELEDDYKQTLGIERKEMEDANAGFQRQIDFIKKSSKGEVTAGGEVSAGGGSSGGAAGGGGEVSAGGGSSGGAAGGGGEVSAASGGQSAPSLESASSPISGSDVSSASSEVAEGQRMESAADQGSVINAPVNNNSSGSTGSNVKPPAADVWNSDFANILATT